MQFFDDSLLPENQQPLVIQVAPYGPEFLSLIHISEPTRPY